MTDVITAEPELEELEDEEMPPDELEEGEELVTEIPVHGVAVLEGKSTGDGRGFRPGALSFGRLPAPLGFEYVSTHGGDTSEVAIIGRIDEFWTVPAPGEDEGVMETRWRGVIMPSKPHAALAVESIIDGSYDGVSIVPDFVEVDVTERREEMRKQILAERAASESEDGEIVESEEMSVEEILDMMVGDGKQETTWFSKGRIRRFDMVPTGAFQEGYIALGHDFVDELTPEAIEASVTALADCGCMQEAGFEIEDVTGDPVRNARAAAQAIIASAMTAEGVYAPGTKDGPGWITHPIPTSRIRRYWTKGKGAAKIRWGVPGDFNRCRMQLAKYVQNPEWLAGLCANMHKEAIGVWPGQEGPGGRHSLVASAEPAPLFTLVAAATPVDHKLFADPQLTGPTGITIDGDHIYGHIAVWNVCHIGQPEGRGSCTLAPRSLQNYAHFRTGTVITDVGPIPVGSITMNTGHAGGSLSARGAAAHYDNTGAVVADVACGEDAHGIWFSGRVRPGTSEEDIYALLASGRISGDWRQIGQGYELVAALVVNVPGYGYANASLVASGEGITAVIGEGIVEPEDESVTAIVGENGREAIIPLTREDIFGITEMALDQYIERTARAELTPAYQAAREALDARRLASARAALALKAGV